MKIFCANCGSQNGTDQVFCRGCGFNLETSIRSLQEQAGNLSIPLGRRIATAMGAIGFAGLAVVFLVGFGYLGFLLISRFILSGEIEKVVLGIVLLALIVFGALALAFIVSEETRKRAERDLPRSTPPDEIEARTATYLPEARDFDLVPSVVEDSTELLGVRKITNKLK
ncbi:MAG: hypothetical protein IPN69_14325 [Acidobacteria bacterium]|nr:hypothetical protein [Acidobacteriota bacterium]